MLRFIDYEIFHCVYLLPARRCHESKLEKIYLKHRAPLQFSKYMPYLSSVFLKMSYLSCRIWSRGLIRYIFGSMFSSSLFALVNMQISMPCILVFKKVQNITSSAITCLNYLKIEATNCIPGKCHTRANMDSRVEWIF